MSYATLLLKDANQIIKEVIHKSKRIQKFKDAISESSKIKDELQVFTYIYILYV